MSNSSIWPIDRTQGQSGPGSDGSERVLRIPQIFSITEALPSDSLVSYPGYSWGKSYPSAGMQSVYSTVPADWATLEIKGFTLIASVE